MQKVMVQVDWYVKTILTLIAVLLAGLLAKPYIVSKPAVAYRDVQEVKVMNWPWEMNVEAWVSNWPRDTGKTMDVKIVDACIIDTRASIQGGLGVLTVVDWKEEEAFLKHIRGE